MKTFFKHLSIQIFILLSIGVGYAAWNTLVTDGETLTATKWNDIVNQLIDVTNDIDNLSFSGGNVGIGTTEPIAQLHVENGNITLSRNDGQQSFLDLEVNSSFIDSEIRFRRNGVSNWRIISQNEGSGDAFDIRSASSKFTISQSGRVGIGLGNSQQPENQLHVEQDASSGMVAKFINTSTSTTADGVRISLGPNSNPESGNHFLQFRDGDGDIIGKIQGDGVGGVTYNTSSDRNLKENIVDTHVGLTELMNIQVRDYNFITAPGKRKTGFIAQELYEVYPSVVSIPDSSDIQDYWSVAYGELTPLITQAIQDLKNEKDSEIQQLRKQIEMLENTLGN